MKGCPVRRCDAVIADSWALCHPDWMRLPLWAREDLKRLHETQAGSDLERRTIAAAVAYLDDQAAEERRTG